MPATILEKYGEARLPRYTSYPTAPRFSPAIGAGSYGDWLGQLPAGDPVSLYLHIPFCRSMCWYCGCHTTITRQDQPILDYLTVLRDEIRMVAGRIPHRLPVGEVHFGGGTPTIMEPAEFLSLMALLREHYDFSDTTGIAVEIDPRRLTAEMAQALGAAGVTRASLGVQSFDPVVQKAINRIQTEKQTAEATDNLRRAGVGGINFDLIYGLPHQTVQSCIDTANAAIAMLPDRFAVFGYAHIPSFKKHQRMIDEAALPDGAARNEQAEAIAETLVAAGYRQIGLDHFALPGDDLVRFQQAGRLRRNFQGYTTDSCETLIGFGASAIGRMKDGYVQNEVAPGLYAQHIASGRLATAKGYRLTEEDRLRAEIIERLMCDFSADIGAICRVHGVDVSGLLAGNDRLAELAGDGVLTIADGVLRVSREHRFVIRAVAAAFDAYIDHSTRTHSKAA
ncbi:oxygen-independent coproporphyrinogen III oxidase [Mesorhizobium sp. CC13]|uniref:oxygen-independent coproporphyrinogen III oxidase n=1 Tax=Mesorhizobium sp. CC13 TaxID=3029194 RepID=UPI0032652931